MKKATSIILILIMSAVVILSIFCIAFEYGHDCEHDECPICCLVAQCEQTLHQLSSAIVSSITHGLALLIVLVIASNFSSIVISNTLVSSKVRLNN